MSTYRSLHFPTEVWSLTKLLRFPAVSLKPCSSPCDIPVVSTGPSAQAQKVGALAKDGLCGGRWHLRESYPPLWLARTPPQPGRQAPPHRPSLRPAFPGGGCPGPHSLSWAEVTSCLLLPSACVAAPRRRRETPERSWPVPRGEARRGSAPRPLRSGSPPSGSAGRRR